MNQVGYQAASPPVAVTAEPDMHTNHADAFSMSYASSDRSE